MRLRTKFQDEDFELGEVVNAKISDLTCYEDDKRFKLTASAQKGGEHTFFYSSIAEFLEMWEDAPEEPKEHWYISADGDVRSKPERQFCDPVYMKIIGNYFESEEEAKRAVEELKAFKRLKDKGFRFDYVGAYEFLCGNGFEVQIRATMPPEFYEDDEVKQDLIALFGGEE